MPEDDLAALVNLLEQAKVAIEATLEAVEAEYPELEVAGFAFQPASFFLPGLKPGAVTSLPGSVRPGFANSETNTGCLNIVCL